MKQKISSFISGLLGLILVLTTLLVPVSYSVAEPGRDVTLDVKIKRVLNPGNSSLNDNSNNTEDIRAVNKKYSVRQNDEIVVEINLLNPSSQKIISAETWLSYDPKKLTGIKIDNADSKFDLITPGENEFVADKSVVRIGRGNTTGGIDDSIVKVASVHFKVLSSKTNDTTAVKFYDFQPTELGHTNVNIIVGGLPLNVLSTTAPQAVNFVLNSNGSTTPSGSSGGGSNTGGNTTGTGSLYPASNGNLPIPKNIKASTGDGWVTLRWDKATDSRVKYYYIYYTKSGHEYLHRKKVYGTTYTFNNLENGDHYYFVLTSSDANDNESGYSHEISVVVGDPSSIVESDALSQQALDSLSKLSKTAATGPVEDSLLLLAILSCLVYPTFKLLKNMKSAPLI